MFGVAQEELLPPKKVLQEEWVGRHFRLSRHGPTYEKNRPPILTSALLRNCRFESDMAFTLL